MAHNTAVDVARPVPQEEQQRQVPAGSPRPNRHSLRNALVLLGLVLAVVAVLVIAARPSPVPAQSTSEQTGQGSIGPVLAGNPPAQTEPSESGNEVVAPAAPVVVNYQVTWTEVQGFNPGTIPVEEGFYNGSQRYSNLGFSPGSKESNSDIVRFAWNVLPQLVGNHGILLEATRDASDRNVVLVEIAADANPQRLLLSVDGEQSWCELNVLLPVPDEFRPDFPAEIRVRVEDDTIRLYAEDGRLGIHWWVATVKRSDLPCS